MRKKWKPVCRAAVLFMTLVSLLPFCQSGMHVYAAEESPPGQIEKVFLLTSGETLQVPRHIVEEGVAYELDEASIVVEETENGSAEGADVATFSKRVEDLSDNDLARIDKKAVIGGIDCELLSVVYKVEEEDENGIPIRYSAACEYGGLKKYSTSYPTAWRLTACYNLCEMLAGPEVVEIQEEEVIQENADFEGAGARTKRVTSQAESEGKDKDSGEKEPEEEEPFPRPEIRRIRIKQSSDEESKKITDLLFPLAAAAAAAGVTVPFIVWFSILTAPLFGEIQGGKYRYIGQIRLKKEQGVYAAYLTKRLRGRAELPVFRIKLPGRVWRKTKTGVFLVHCPGGKKIMTTVGKTVHFTVEGD